MYGIQASFSACRPLIFPVANNRIKADCLDFNRAMLNVISERNIPNVVLAGAWPTKESELDVDFIKSIHYTLRQLKGKNVWIFTDVPVNRRRAPSELARAVIEGQDVETIGVPTKAYTVIHDRIKQAFANNSPVPFEFIDASGILCGNRSHCRVQHGGRSLYYDRSHLTTCGAMFIGKAFERAFETIRQQQTGIRARLGMQ